MVGANPVSDCGHLACPRFTTAQAAFLAGSAGHEVDFILEEAGKLVALEIKVGIQVTGDLIGIQAFRDALKRKASLVRGVILHSDKARPLDADDIALPWGWMVPEPR